MLVNPMVSVIMGVYNPDKKYLLDSINSILNQTFQDFEIIICDDGSTTNVDILKKIERMDNRIKIFKNSNNMGLAHALNICITNSKGRYLVRQDADDISDKYRIEKQVEFLEENIEFAFVGANVNYIDEYNNIWGHYNLKNEPKREDFVFRVPFMHGAVAYRREIFDSKDNYYRVIKQTRRCEDYDLFMRLYAKGYKGCNIQEYLYNVREDKNALKRRKFIYRIDEIIIRKEGFKSLKLRRIYYIFILKPIIIGIIPNYILIKLKDIIYKRKTE